MAYDERNRQQLIDEVTALRQRVAELEASEAWYVQALQDSEATYQNLIEQARSGIGRAEAVRMIRGAMAGLADASLSPRGTGTADDLTAIVSWAVAILQADGGGLYSYCSGREVLAWRLGVGTDLPPAGTTRGEGQDVAGRAWATAEPVVVDDYQGWEHRLASAEGYHWGAVMAAPIFWQDQFLGALQVLRSSARPFLSADVELLSMLATQVGIVLHNAELYEADRRARELETAYGELQSAQDTLVKAERMSAMNQLIVSLCHEINNPLTVVLGYAQWLQAEGTVFSTDVRQALEAIEASAVQIRDVVRALGEVKDRLIPYVGGTMMIDILGQGTEDEADEADYAA